jgi:hemoglobin
MRSSLARSLLLAVAVALGASAAVAAHAQTKTSPAPTGETLYKRLGGYDALAAVTDDFIGRMAADPALSRFFVGHSDDSKKRIRQLVVDQLCGATGGPCYYIGRDMRSVHAGLAISEADWQKSVDLLVASLDTFKVPQREKDEVLAAIGGLKKDIVIPATPAPGAGGSR